MSCLEHYIPEQHGSIDESMVPHFGKHGAKQYIHSKSIKFGYKTWVMAKLFGYCAQFGGSYAGKDVLTEYGDVGIKPSILICYIFILIYILFLLCFESTARLIASLDLPRFSSF